MTSASVQARALAERHTELVRVRLDGEIRQVPPAVDKLVDAEPGIDVASIGAHGVDGQRCRRVELVAPADVRLARVRLLEAR